MAQDDRLVPSAQTTYASDRSFGYATSNLRHWVEEKTRGAVRAADVLSLGLEDIRGGGPDRVREILAAAEARRPVVVNATEYADLEVVVLGLLEAEAAGQAFVYRCGPSFVRVRGGIEPAPPLSAEALYARRAKDGHGLVLVGSHVETTTRQLEPALALDGVHAQGAVGRAAARSRHARAGDRGRAGRRSRRHLPEREVILYTSRELARAEGSDQALDVGRSVSDALVELVQRLDPGLPLAFCVAKGGITASDIGTRGFGVRRAEVAGQMLPGTISVWILPRGLRLPRAALRDLPGQRRRARHARRGHRAARGVSTTRFAIGAGGGRGRGSGRGGVHVLRPARVRGRGARGAGARRAGDRSGRHRLVRRAGRRAPGRRLPRRRRAGAGAGPACSSTTPPTAS